MLADVVRTSTQVAGSASRLAKTRLIADCLRRLDAEEVAIALPYLSGELRQGKLTLGYAALQASLGAPAAAPTLTLHDVDWAFESLKTVKGKGAAARRAALLESLFSRSTAEEQDFLVRLIVGELRQGALEGVMFDAVAAAVDLPAAEVRRAATFAGGIAPVAQAALAGGASALAVFSIRLMQPVLPMLAQPVADVQAALAQLGTAILEWKLDGARVQVHKSGSEVRVFTRNLNDVTAAVPEVVDVLKNAKAESLILDGEAIALRADGKPHPFQVTMRRFGRKLDVEKLRAELPLSVFFFDCLYRDGAPLVDRPAAERHDIVRAVLPSGIATPSLITSQVDAAEAFYQQALAQGHEGIMAKATDAAYEAGRRGAAWLKIKRAHTLDLVVLAAEWGHGRRRGWLSNLHLGARDPASGGFVMLGKTFKGLTDAILEWQTAELLARETGRDEWTVHVRPELVVEIEFNDLQESPHYPAGLALRFARLKGYRPDKRPDEADTIDSVRQIYEKQL
ncbi:MAG: ATP-dependent DNA ligase [Betaproteobacteria bacterium]|nr:MAG: ATP-dependent DNA ligase [Betaproteobacteria bacterium]